MERIQGTGYGGRLSSRTEMWSGLVTEPMFMTNCKTQMGLELFPASVIRYWNDQGLGINLS